MRLYAMGLKPEDTQLSSAWPTCCEREQGVRITSEAFQEYTYSAMSEEGKVS